MEEMYKGWKAKFIFNTIPFLISVNIGGFCHFSPLVDISGTTMETKALLHFMIYTHLWREFKGVEGINKQPQTDWWNETGLSTKKATHAYSKYDFAHGHVRPRITALTKKKLVKIHRKTL